MTPQETLRQHIADSPAVVEAVARALHEGDWTMAGGNWPWRYARGADRQAWLHLAVEVLLLHATGVRGDALVETVEEMVADGWPSKPRHGARRRVEAKAFKIEQWLSHHEDLDFADGPVVGFTDRLA